MASPEQVVQAGEDGAVAVGEGRFADLALEDEQLVPEYEDLDVLVSEIRDQSPDLRG